MIDWLTGLWENNKFLFWILLPCIIIAFVVKLFLDGNFEGAIDTVNDTQDKDNKLAKDQNEANAKANAHKENADKIEEKINDNNNSNGDANWHKRNQ
jgi:hypothetical protein